MPSDLLTYKVLASELDSLLKGGKIQRITQPEKDEVRLTVRSAATYNLVISVNPNAPRLHVADDKKDNPYTAPTFCMLLRKHLSGSVLNGIEIFNCDRIFKLSFTGKSEMQDVRSFSLYVELMSRYSNIILTDENDKILDSAVRLGLSLEAKRIIMPNVKYLPPEKGDKAELFQYGKIAEKLSAAASGDLVSDLLKSVNGLSRESAAEIVFRARKNTVGETESLVEQITFFNDIYQNNKLIPCALPDYSNFFVTPYLSLMPENDYVKFDSLNAAVNACFTLSDKKIRKESYAKDIVVLVRRHRDKLLKKIGYAEEKLKECANMEKSRVLGELLTANLYRVKKGDKSVTVENYYDEMKPCAIPLDVTKSPQQNAASYYNKYNKLKRAEDFSNKQLEQYKLELNYINSVWDALSRADISDVEDIKEELKKLKIIKTKSAKKGEKKPAKSQPKSFECGGFKIYVGTNNILNNEVTFKLGRSFDIWLHVKEHHGSHVIIRKNAETDVVPESVIAKAAQAAAFYSEASKSDNVAVDYTERRNVRRIKDGGPGMVTYENYKTVFVKPNLIIDN